MIVCIYIIRLLGLQVMDSRYKEVADSNAFMRKTLYPSRGMIRDRNDKLVVYNQPAYDVMMIPKTYRHSTPSTSAVRWASPASSLTAGSPT